MRKRWEIVYYPTDAKYGQERQPAGGAVIYTREGPAARRAARLNDIAKRGNVIAYEVREMATGEPRREKFEPWSHRWLVQGTKRDIKLDQHWYLTKRSADSWSRRYACGSTWDYTPQRNPLVPEIPRSIRMTVALRRAIFVALVAIEAYVVGWRHVEWWIASSGVAIVAASNIWSEIAHRRYVNGLRRAARDRHDSRTSTGQTSGAGTSNTNPGTSPGPLTASGGLVTSLIPFYTASRGGINFNPPPKSPGSTFNTAAFVQSLNASQNAMSIYMTSLAKSMGLPAPRAVTGSGPIPEREDDTPILGYKTATLVWARTEEHQTYQPTLESVYSATAFNLTADRAECHRGGDHTAPDLACTCGFYAVRERERVENFYGQAYVLLDVELFGKVIVYEHGYRAERQRILSIGVRGCWYCNETPSHLVGQAPTPWSRTDTTADLISVCAEHLPLAGANLIFTTEEIGEVLGAPVRHEPSLMPTVDPGRMNS